MRHNALAVALGNQRPHAGFRVTRIARGNSRCQRFQLCQEARVNRFVNIKARRGDTNLTGMGKNTVNRALGGRIQVGIGKNKHR